MQLRLLVFASAADRAGFRERLVDYSPEETPRTLLARAAPGLLPEGIRVAVDCEYHDWDSPIGAAEEVAIIPPVSGG
jgi:molybdopterin synthase sulfur carrier subunit